MKKEQRQSKYIIHHSSPLNSRKITILPRWSAYETMVSSGSQEKPWRLENYMENSWWL